MMKMNKILYIVRGIPGCGKSTLAESLTPYHYEADAFFMNNGEYRFDANRLHEAHQWCLAEVEAALRTGFKKVAVSNTNTTEKELKPYMELGKKYGYTVISLIVENRHGGKNVHNVPDEVLTKMKNRFSVKL